MKAGQIPFGILLGAVTLLFLYLLKPFFFPLFWAVVIAGIFKPLYRRIDGRLRRPNLSTLIVFAVAALCIFLPLGVAVTLVFDQSVDFYKRLGAGAQGIDFSSHRIIALIVANPLVERLAIDEAFLSDKVVEVIRSITNYLLVHLTALTQNTLDLLVKFGIMFYSLFFFIRDGESLLNKAMQFSPLGGTRERQLYHSFLATARSTLMVTLIIGGLQGILGGAVFFNAGIEGSLIWAVLMILMAIVPVVGCSIIWAPAGLLMLLTGHLWEGILILASGFLLISTIDNLLRPLLIGKDVALHPLLIFLSTLGGIALFGLSGFVIGPIIAALLLALWRMGGEFFDRTANSGPRQVG
jgi:predicted PurR-regulated permease PerM